MKIQRVCENEQHLYHGLKSIYNDINSIIQDNDSSAAEVNRRVK